MKKMDDPDQALKDVRAAVERLATDDMPHGQVVDFIPRGQVERGQVMDLVPRGQVVDLEVVDLVEVTLYVTVGVVINCEPDKPGFYFWFGLPGCLPDSKASGPYDTEQNAIIAARDMLTQAQEHVLEATKEWIKDAGKVNLSPKNIE